MRIRISPPCIQRWSCAPPQAVHEMTEDDLSRMRTAIVIKVGTAATKPAGRLFLP